jgi:FixJ family two-component response regulator
MKSDSTKISIVDDDESIRTATRGLLRSAGYQVETFASAELFLESSALRKTDCLILDIRMPGIDGLELQRRLNDAQSHIPIIFVTAHDDKSYRMTAMDAGASNFLHKPFEANAFVAAIQAALRSRPSSESSEPKRGRSPPS